MCASILVLVGTSDADPDLYNNLKVGAGFVWKDTNPEIRIQDKYAMTKNLMCPPIWTFFTRNIEKHKKI